VDEIFWHIKIKREVITTLNGRAHLLQWCVIICQHNSKTHWYIWCRLARVLKFRLGRCHALGFAAMYEQFR